MLKRLNTITLALACTWAVLLPGGASATISNENTGSYDVVPLYRSYLFGGIDRDGGGTYQPEDIFGIDYVNNYAPRGPGYINGTVSANGASFTGTGQSVWSGFYAGRNYAQISVNNSNANDAYYLVAGQGTATSVKFFTADAAASYATFTWHVSGVESNPSGLGRTTGRLDFGASTDSSVNWTHLFYDTEDKLNSITEFGPGTYTYKLPIADLGTAINLFYWSSAFAQVLVGDAPQGSNVTLTANYANTFVLDTVQLYDTNDQAVSQWSMDDLNLGKAVFNQDGRLEPILAAPPIPEPGTVAMMLAGLVAMLGMARRRRLPAD